MAKFHTISITNDCQEEKREFATEEEARQNASIDTNNNIFRLYRVDTDNGIAKTTYLGRLPSIVDFDFEHYELYCVNEKEQHSIICAFDNQQQAREYINTLKSDEQIDHYVLYRIKSSVPNQQPIVELVYLVPGNYDIEYYSLRGMNEFGDETQIIGFKTLEELQEHILVPSKEYIQYNYYEVYSKRKNGKAIEYRTLILQKNNLPQKKRKRKKHKQQ